VAHEKSLNFEEDGVHILIKTVVDGRQRSAREAIRLFKQGKNPAMGRFRRKKDLDRAIELFSQTDKIPFPKRKPTKRK